MAMTGLLDGRIAVITGGTRGLGHAIARRFAAEGCRGALIDLAQAKAEGDAPSGFTVIAGDVGDEASLAAAVRQTLTAFGTLDIVIANAGVVPPTLKHTVPALKERGGAIVAMASINAFTAHPRQMLYTASKHAVLGIVRAAARDLGRHGIRVNAVAPGPIATDALIERIRKRALAGPSEEEALANLAQETALGRLATADEVAKAALFLASDLASGISGELLPVDAGLP
jgi:NAD(P)-dependent dehydrogenase (short-subunit alcohol dehydrogenase family)